MILAAARGRRGASLTGYGLIVGLIAVAALSAVSGLGVEVKELFQGVGDTITDAAPLGGGNGEGEGEGEGEGLPALSLGSGTLTVAAISGGSSPGACTDLAVSNPGTAPVTGLSLDAFTGTDASNFQPCTGSSPVCGITLAAGAGCNFGVQLTASSGGSFSAVANASADAGLTATRDVEGSASGFPPTGCPTAGQTCSDGTVNAGTSQDPNPPCNGSCTIYAPRCDIGRTWNGSSCDGTSSWVPWNDGTAGFTNTPLTDYPSNPTEWTGKSNTAVLVGLAQQHMAAEACDDLVAHGHDDWYLPAGEEMNQVFANRTSIGNFVPNPPGYSIFYWTSTEGSTNFARARDFPDSLTSVTKNQNVMAAGNDLGPFTRCIRR
jgi:Flp pilus assembly pilin Flp